jgi:hypothetical protein
MTIITKIEEDAERQEKTFRTQSAQSVGTRKLGLIAKAEYQARTANVKARCREFFSE